jgi:hypothetical protein
MMDEDERLPPRLSSADVELVKAVADIGGRLVPVTPEMLADWCQTIQERRDAIAETFPALVRACPYEMRLAITAWVFAAIVAHARDRGTFRFLIYDRLGFEPDAYLPLYDAGGMDISNELDLTHAKERTPKGRT